MWDFGGLVIIGGILSVVFYFLFRYIDREEYVFSKNNGFMNVEVEGVVVGVVFKEIIEK